MKILNIIWKFSTGGIGKCFLTYAALADVDSSVKVVSICIDPQSCDYDREPLKRMGVNVIPIKHKLDFSWMRKVKVLIADENPDLIFCHGFNGPVVIQLVKCLFHINVPMVCSYHGEYQAPTKIKKVLEPIYNRLQLLIYKHYAEKIVSVSDFSKKELCSKGVPRNKVVVVHNGIRDENAIGKVNIISDVITIGLISRLDPIKGIECLLEAVPILKNKFRKNFHVYIVGDGPLYQNLSRAIFSLKIENNVTLVGYQPNVTEWLNALDVFCLPSLSENHSIALLEAMRAGKAIVATNVGGNEESVADGEQALIVPAKDAEALANALAKFIDSKELRIQYGRRARERFQNEFTEDTMKRNLISVFKSVIDEKK